MKPNMYIDHKDIDTLNRKFKLLGVKIDEESNNALKNILRKQIMQIGN